MVDDSLREMIKVRALFISDVHLGTKHSKAEELLHFLKRYDAEQIYLVGDIIDFWHFRRTKLYWPESHTRVLLELTRLAKTKRVWYIPGNHDEDLRIFDGSMWQGIKIVNETWHTTKGGHRYLVIHGDQFDTVIQNAKWLAFFGDRLYEMALQINRFFGIIQRFFHLPHWSFSAWCKHKVKQAVQFVGHYEMAVLDAVAKRDVQGVLCGHIHCAANKYIGAHITTPAPPVHYLNCGDWVESLTAIIENTDGELEVVEY
jgi:UDP-2,3-diacylglucosamine pyrophosphatase LpxH